MKAVGSKIRLQLTPEQFKDICAALALGAQFLDERNVEEERAGYLDSDTERERYIEAQRWERFRKALLENSGERERCDECGTDLAEAHDGAVMYCLVCAGDN